MVLSADEIGPIQLIPHGGQGGFPEKRPARIPAEYPMEFGTVYNFLTPNVFHPQLFGWVYRTKHSVNGLDHLKEVRSDDPADRSVNLIQDGASTHRTAQSPSVGAGEQGMPLRHAHARQPSHPVECHAGDVQKLAVPGQTFTTPKGVGATPDAAVHHRNEERKVRGKRFRDTVRTDHP